MRSAKQIASFSRCRKQQVGCVLVAAGGAIVGVGSNDVRYPLDECPRKSSPTGQGYEMCVNACHQYGHAEVEAVRDYMAAGQPERPISAYLWGHYYACQDCMNKLQYVGVETVFILDPDRWVDDLPVGADE